MLRGLRLMLLVVPLFGIAVFRSVTKALKKDVS